MNSSSEPNRETPAIADLPALVIVCEHAGPCRETAEWAIRAHSMIATEKCPRVVLLCGGHLEQARRAYALLWQKVNESQVDNGCRCGQPHRFACSIRHQPVDRVEDFIWGVERINS